MNNINWIFFDIGSTLVDESVAYQNRIEKTISGSQVSYKDFVAQPPKSLKLENRVKKVYSNNGDEYVDNSRWI